MASILSFPVGVRLHPSDEELATHYLKIKVTGQPLPSGWETMMVERDIYGEEATPWKLFNDNDPWHIPVGPSGSLLSNERVIYVYTKLSKIGKTGNKNNNRIAGCGHWHGNSKINCLTQDGEVIGKKRSFTFKSKEENVDSWTMHEYSLDGVGCQDQDNNNYVLCKIKRKAGRLDSGTNVLEKAVQDSLGKRRIVPEKGNHCAATKKLRSDPPNTDAFMMDPQEYPRGSKQECISSADAAPANIPLFVGEYAFENPNLDESVMNLGGEQTYESSAYAAADSWTMDEYSLDGGGGQDQDNNKYVLCKIKRKAGRPDSGTNVLEKAVQDGSGRRTIVAEKGNQGAATKKVRSDPPNTDAKTYGSSGTGPTQDKMDEGNMNASASVDHTASESDFLAYMLSLPGCDFEDCLSFGWADNNANIEIEDETNLPRVMDEANMNASASVDHTASEFEALAFQDDDAFCSSLAWVGQQYQS